MYITSGKIVYQGTRGVVIQAEYNPAHYMTVGLPRPKYVVEYLGDTILRTDSLDRAKEAAE